MKRILILAVMTLLFVINLSAAFYRDLPMTLVQPDGTEIECLATGDEYFNYLHDAEGFTLIQDQQDGFSYYGEVIGDQIVPSDYRVGEVDPEAAGLRKRALISRQNYLQRKETRDEMMRDGSRAPHFGTLVNLVDYIRFPYQSKFTDTARVPELQSENPAGTDSAG